MDQPYLSSTDAARLLGLSLGAFRMAMVRGHLVPTGRIGKRLLWSVEDLHRQVREHAAKIAVRSVALGSATETEHAEKRNADGDPGDQPGWNTKWILRAVMKGSNGRRLERQKMIDGAHEKPKRAEMRQLEDELEKLREELRQEANAEANGMSLKETVGDFAPRWLEHTATTGKTRKHVVKKRLRHLETFILPSLGDKELRALRRSDVAAWMQNVASLRQPNGKLYGRVTLMGAWSTLRAMLRALG